MRELGWRSGRVVRRHVGKGRRVAKWQGGKVGKVGRVVRGQGERFLVLLENGGRRVS